MAARPRPARYLSLPVSSTKSRSSSVSDRSDLTDRSDDSSCTTSAPGALKKSKPVRKRASKPKVRTGCITCKARHVKCDEAKPGCAACEKLSLICEGYLPPRVKRQVVRTERLLLPRPKSVLIGPLPPTPSEDEFLSVPLSDMTPSGLSILVPSTPLGLDIVDEDGWYFALFRDQIAHELSPYYQSNFWSRTLLRDSTVHQCIRHSILSIGAYARALLDLRQENPWDRRASHPWRSPSLYNRHYQAALEHHDKALNSLRSHVQSHAADNRLAMATTLLFIVFQNMQGNYHRSGDLIRRGIKLLTDMRYSEDNNGRVPLARQWQRQLMDPADEIDEMADMFARHSITYVFVPFPHAKFAYHLLLTEDVEDEESDSEDEGLSDAQLSLPQTIEQARRKWDYLLPILASFQSKAVWRNLNPNYEFDQSAAFEEQTRLLSQLRDFGVVLDTLTPVATDPTVAAPPCGLEVLRLQHMMAIVFVTCCLDPTETLYDNFLHEFETLIQRGEALARTYFQSETPNNVGFMNEVGILLLFAFVGAKCRVRRVRLQALELLRQFDWREGSWDGVRLAYGVEGVMRLEGQMDYSSPSEIPDDFGLSNLGSGTMSSSSVVSSMSPPALDSSPTAEARYAWTNMFWDFDKRQMTLEYSRVLRNEQGGFEKARWEVDEAFLVNKWTYFSA